MGDTGDTVHPDVLWKGNRARYKDPRRFLVNVRFSAQVLHNLRSNAQIDLLFTDRDERISERINNRNIGYSNHEIVELKILR